MLRSVIQVEWIKLRRAPVWIAFLILPLLAALMGTFNYAQNIGILTKEWYSLWTQHTLFASFFFLPSLMGLLCAYQWRLEHRENNWNSLMTQPVPRWTIFTGKLIVASIFSLLTLVFTGLLYVICGTYLGFSAIPAELPGWLSLGFCAAVAIVAVQLLISMLIKSFALPIGIALAGGILGLGMANSGLGLFCPYSLLALGMDANGKSSLSVQTLLPFLLSCAIFLIASVLFGGLCLKQRDIETR